MISSLSASLMMSSEEISILDSITPVDEIGSLFDVPEVSNFNTSAKEDVLFLSAILYFTSTHWTVWINDKTYTADDLEGDALKITKVTNDYIEFQYTDITKKPVKLRANQSLLTVGCRIIDGDARQKPKAIQL